LKEWFTEDKPDLYFEFPALIHSNFADGEIEAITFKNHSDKKKIKQLKEEIERLKSLIPDYKEPECEKST